MVMRRSDNAVIDLIWVRSHNHGSLVEHVRLANITPIVDILADIKEKVEGDVALLATWRPSSSTMIATAYSVGILVLEVPL